MLLRYSDGKHRSSESKPVVSFMKFYEIYLRHHSQDKSKRLILARLIAEINPKINLILVMMHPVYDNNDYN